MGSQMLTDCQALWENRSKSYLYFNALWDPKCLQIARPSGKTDPRAIYISMGSQMLTDFQALWENRSKSYLYFDGIPNAYRLCYIVSSPSKRDKHQFIIPPTNGE